jgi:hypothetical protein
LLAGLGAAAPAAGSASRGNVAAADRGARLWVSRYHGASTGRAAAVAASPDGSTVFVAGTSPSGAVSSDYATVAYAAATGAQRWASRYADTGGENAVSAVAVSPDGNTVFVTGASFGGASSGNDYTTVAYNAVTGAPLWARRYDGPGNGADQATSVAVSPAGGTVFVIEPSFGGADPGLDYATIAYKG